MADLRECEDCEDPIPVGERRRRCSACGLLLCPYCWSHGHALARFKLREQAKALDGKEAPNG